ncbi:unnamed protein product, partial [marine sediment metagenome]
MKITKTLSVKLNQLNNSKNQYLQELYEKVQLISQEYLKIKKQQLETKQYSTINYKPFVSKYSINSAVVQQTFRFVDSKVKSYISWCKKKHKLVKFPKITKTPIILRNDCFRIENSKTKHFNKWFKFTRIYF